MAARLASGSRLRFLTIGSVLTDEVYIRSLTARSGRRRGDGSALMYDWSLNFDSGTLMTSWSLSDSERLMMNLEPLSPDNATVVLVDYAVGFANLLRSHDLRDHIANVVGLAQTAKLYGSGLVVTNGEASKPSGPLYPELLEVLGDQPVIERKTAFNSFLDPDFAEAVRATGRRRLLIGGIATDGCVLQTALGAQREGYEPYVVVDAAASTSKEAHDMAVQRMAMSGIVPVTWWSVAAEFQLEPRFADTPHRTRLMAAYQPAMTMAGRTFFAGVDQGRLTPATA
ncbi:isochorismatase family protein [Nonomuraea sp. SYSU D8015]|uniref:isochorismatase family protein n=1 Tax=Nonomuraea sp. SYSU D8015 TaxID=2593644 RepID=UPI0016614245